MNSQTLIIEEEIYRVECVDDKVVRVIRSDNVSGEVNYIGKLENSDNEQMYNVYFPNTKFSLLCPESSNGNIEVGSIYYINIIDTPDDWNEDELDEMFN